MADRVHAAVRVHPVVKVTVYIATACLAFLIVFDTGRDIATSNRHEEASQRFKVLEKSRSDSLTFWIVNDAVSGKCYLFSSHGVDALTSQEVRCTR